MGFAPLGFLRGHQPHRTTTKHSNPCTYADSQGRPFTIEYLTPTPEFPFSHRQVFPARKPNSPFAPSLFNPPPHYHLLQDEHFKVESGRGVWYLEGGKKIHLQRGDEIVVPKWKWHWFETDPDLDPDPYHSSRAGSDTNQQDLTHNDDDDDNDHTRSTVNDNISTNTTSSKNTTSNPDNDEPFSVLYRYDKEYTEMEYRFFKNTLSYLSDCHRAGTEMSIFQLQVFCMHNWMCIGIVTFGPEWFKFVANTMITLSLACVGEYLLGYESWYPEYYEENTRVVDGGRGRSRGHGHGHSTVAGVKQM